MGRQATGLDRRSFLRTGVQAAAGAALLSAGAATARAPKSKTITMGDGIPRRRLGRTEHVLPIFGHGGSAMVEPFRSTKGGLPPVSFEDNVKMVRHGYEKGIRYFDTARSYRESESIMGEALSDVRENIYLASKVGTRNPDETRQSVETSLGNLKTDYVDCMQLHTPSDYDAAMRTHEHLLKMRDEGMIRFIGVTTHVHFPTVYRLIETGGFDQVLLAYGYFRKGMVEIMSNTNASWRDLCLAKAAEMDLGVVAMKVLGANIFSHNAKNLLPNYDDKTRASLAAAAIKWVVRDERVHMLNLGISIPEDIDTDWAILEGDLTLTGEDQVLLADASSKAYETEFVKEMRVV